MRICEVFLGKNAKDDLEEESPTTSSYPAEQLALLKEKMTDFIKLCGFAIKLNKSLISSEHLPFQEMVEKKYEALKEATRVYTDV